MSKKGIFLILATAVISGVSVFVNKFAVSVSNPYLLTFLKNGLVAIMIMGAFLGAKEFNSILKLKKEQWAKLFLIGLLGGAVPFLLFFKGLSMTSAAQGSFVHKSMFIFTSLLAVVFLKEKINKAFVAGGILIFLGNLLALKSLSITFNYGDGLIFLAVIFWSIENILSKSMLFEVSPKIVAWGRMFLGSIFILSFLFLTGQFKEISSLNISQASWVAVTGVLLFGYVISWYNGLKFLPVSAATTILVLGSSITSAISAVYYGKIALSDFLSAVSIILGTTVIIAFSYANNQKSAQNKLIRD